jgi:hypothetical protein
MQRGWFGSLLAPLPCMRWIALIAAVLAIGCEPDWGEVPAPVVPSLAPPPPPPPPPRPPAAETTPQHTSALTLTDAESDALDPRRSHLAPRPSSLLIADTSGLSALLRTTATRAADRPRIMRRLAENYVELAEASEREARRRDPSDAGRTAEIRKTIVQTRMYLAWTARQAAIACYTLMLRTPSTPPYPMQDEVRWYLALEKARAGDVDGARRDASELIALSPDSMWAARAHFLLGVELTAHAEAQKEFLNASHASDPALARAALERLGSETRAVGAVALQDRPSRATPPMAPRVTPTPPCSTDFDCPGANACHDGKCVDPFAGP